MIHELAGALNWRQGLYGLAAPMREYFDEAPPVKNLNTAKTNNEVCTPSDLLGRVLEALDAPIFDLDPCSHPRSVVPCCKALLLNRYAGAAPPANTGRVEYVDDSIVEPWPGLVWLNPPYSSLPNHGWMGYFHEVERGVALVPVRTTARWWQCEVTKSDVVTFLKKRVTHVGEKDGAPFPQALVYRGPDPEDFARRINYLGWTVLTGAVHV